jgi:membrane-associated phospholipid phosphatase
MTPLPLSPARSADQSHDRWRLIRWTAAACYVAAFVLSACFNGVPLFRISVIGWTLGAFAVYSLGRGWRMFGRALTDWLPYTAVMVGYDLSRGAADELGNTIHIAWPASADRWLFGGTVPTVWLQERLYTPGVVHLYDVLASLVYFSFFLAVPVTMAALWVRDRGLWLGFTAKVVVLSLAALVTYAVFPEAPPWYAARHHVIGAVHRISSVGWSALGLRSAGDIIERGQALSNNVAAMPSLHLAYTVLVALFFLRQLRRWWARCLILAYPLAMALALVYTGEHYVIDVVAGIVYPVAVDAAVSAVLAARVRRRSLSVPVASPRRALAPGPAQIEPADAPS